ncbi:MAG: oligosaccharide flippase family protein [Stellaceae bacterium]
MKLSNQAISVGVMHAATALQPLIILPYAGHILGPHYFGVYAYAMTIEQFIVSIVGYGFHWTAQRAAASARNEPAVLSALLAEVSAAGCLLLVLVSVAGLAVAGPVLPITKSLYMCLLLGGVGAIAFPAWLFIGIERPWQATIPVVSSRLIALVCFVTLVRSPAQLNLAVAIQSSVPFVSGVMCLPFLYWMGLSGFRSLTLGRIKRQLVDGWRGFQFTLAERISMILPVPLVEHIAGYAAAGQFSVAEKFVTATRIGFRAVVDTLLPRVAYYAAHDPAKGISLIRRSFLTLVGGVMVSLAMFFIAPPLIILFFGAQFSPAISIVRSMAILPLILNANTCLSTLYMLNYGHERAWALLAAAGLLCLISVSYVGSVYIGNPTMAVVLGMIAKEILILVVAAVFFVRFSQNKAMAYSDHDMTLPLHRLRRLSVIQALPDQIQSDHHGV